MWRGARVFGNRLAYLGACWINSARYGSRKTLCHRLAAEIVRQIQQLSRLETVVYTLENVIEGQHDYTGSRSSLQLTGFFDSFSCRPAQRPLRTVSAKRGRLLHGMFLCADAEA